ncbi:BQ5605_C006g03855 [Microbotryum silenes-dioicae]|uniref:BQ5605_C006g03855 protein n=1 Tax=Microbotryum silenes-dioicae TaxID=796604 RepID=A0A2X0M8B3_9BASI|nr:BQ5605_C006g03855 [Microbotryum silenes-dioicae]
MVNHVPRPDTSYTSYTSYGPRSWTLGGGGGGPSDSLSSTSAFPTSPTASGPSSFVASTPTSNGHLGRSAGPSGGKGKMRAKEVSVIRVVLSRSSLVTGHRSPVTAVHEACGGRQVACQHRDRPSRFGLDMIDALHLRRRRTLQLSHRDELVAKGHCNMSCYVRSSSVATSYSTNSFESVPIQNLPTKLLSHVFAHLSPSSLNAAQLVCRRWNESAFETYYGLVAPNGSVSLGRRIESTSWKAEYRSRVLLLHRWSKSRTPALTHNPDIGLLSSMHIHLPFSQGAATGSSSPCTPHAVLSPVLLSLSEQLGRPFGFAPIPVTSSVISPDGTRIVFGMADVTIRIVSCGATGRGVVAGVGERGEVRAIANVHREGTDVVALAFGRPDPRARADVFVSVGQDGLVAVWQVSSNSNARDRMAPAIKLWSTRVDSRLAAIALGLSTGAVLCWTQIDLETRHVQEPAETVAFHELDLRTTDPINALHFDHSPMHESHRLLVHATGHSEFLKYSFDAARSPPARVVFAHPFKHLGNLTAFAFNFDEPPASLALVHSTLREGRITGFTPNDPSTPVHENLPTSSSKASLASLAGSTVSLFEAEPGHSSSDIQQPGGSSSFGRCKFVVAGDASGRVHTWDWDVNSTDANVDPHQTTTTSESRVTALEVTEAMIFVGSLDAAGQIDANDKERWSVSHIRAN